jgi:hypothetical protein
MRKEVVMVAGALATPVTPSLIQHIADTGIYTYDDFLTAVVAVFCLGETFDAGPMRLVYRHGNELPDWVERAFMRLPELWPNGKCALKRKAASGEWLDTELSFLQDVAGTIHHFIGNMCGDHRVNIGQPMTTTQCEALYNDGWRVD